MARRSSQLKRKVGRRGPSKLILVVCGGERTEPRYVHGIAQEFRKPSVRIEVVGEGVDPLSLVELAVRKKKELLKEAKKSKNSFDTNFEIWAIFDTDEFGQIPQARQLASEENVHVAQSNPCFEVWGIYHYREYDAPDDAQECQRKLASLCEHYDCGGKKEFLFERLSSDRTTRIQMLQDACERAERGLIRRHEEDIPNGRPSSEVHNLIAQIRQA